MPLITIKNKPKVKMVKGSVKNTNTGLMNAFNNPKTTATVKAVTTPYTRTPFIK